MRTTVTAHPQSMPPSGDQVRPRPSASRLRSLLVSSGVLLAFLIVAGQLVRLAMVSRYEMTASMSEPIATNHARPDLADRNGRLLATDVEAPSLFADPAMILDRDEVAEKLSRIFPDLDATALRELIADRKRRFAWIRRGLPPAVAQRVHDLGLPGLAFRRELRRAYPAGRLAGHVIGAVNIDNKGLDGLERHLDEIGGIDAVQGTNPSERPPVRLSLDIGVQHALEDELRDAVARYQAAAAAGIVLDVDTGEVLASGSLPDTDPARPSESLDPARLDKITDGTYELGSLFKIFTLAQALDAGTAKLDTTIDVRRPIVMGRYTIKDLHPAGRPLTVAEIFLHSSNVGAGLLALEAGPEKQRAFLQRLGLTGSIRTEQGPVAAPQLPGRWDQIETVTISFGHGIAVSPLQFAAAAAAVVNGGELVAPTFLRRQPGVPIDKVRVLDPGTSAQMRELMRRNVTDAAGTGRRADAPGYRVGGKTGTAEMPGRGGYRENAVISSFLAAFPMDAPRYLTLVMLFEPKASKETRGEITAGLNAAPTTSRLIARIAPLLGVLPAAEPSRTSAALE